MPFTNAKEELSRLNFCLNSHKGPHVLLLGGIVQTQEGQRGVSRNGTITLAFVELLYQRGFGLIFEIIPKPVYEDEEGGRYLYDYHESKAVKTETAQLREILTIERVLPKRIEGRASFRNERYLGVVDERKNFYRFIRFESLRETERQSLI